MNNNSTYYKPRVFGIAPVSPYKSQPVAKRSAVGISIENNPVIMKEVARHIGEISLVVVTDEDKETIQALRIPGLIAYRTRVMQNGRVVSIGRSTSVVSPKNKYIDRVVTSTAGYSILDSVSKLVRLDTLWTGQSTPSQDKKEVTLTDAYEKIESHGVDMASEKQKSYLFQLLYQNHSDEGIIESESQKINSYSKKEASDAIKLLVD